MLRTMGSQRAGHELATEHQCHIHTHNAIQISPQLMGQIIAVCVSLNLKANPVISSFKGLDKILVFQFVEFRSLKGISLNQNVYYILPIGRI